MTNLYSDSVSAFKHKNNRDIMSPSIKYRTLKRTYDLHEILIDSVSSKETPSIFVKKIGKHCLTRDKVYRTASFAFVYVARKHTSSYMWREEERTEEERGREEGGG